MATILNPNDTNRLVEVLAGSTTLLSDPTGGGTLPLSLDTILPGDTADLPAVTELTGHAGGEASLTPIDPSSLLGAASLADPGSLLNPVTSIVDGTLGSDTSDLLGVGDVLNLGTPALLEVAGPDGAAQPVFDATNILVKDFHAELEVLSHQTGTSDILHAVTNLGETVGLGNTGVLQPSLIDGHTNLITDVVNAPATLLNGGLDDVIAHVGGDLGDTVHATFGVVGAVLNGSDPINPIPDLLQSVGADLQNLPLLNINGGTSAGDGGLLGGGALGGGLLNGLVGNLNHSSSGHLADVDVGPQNTGGLGLDLLAAPGSDATHTASVNAVDVGPNGPQLVDLGVVTGAGIISVPGLGGAGSDGLVGGLLGHDGLGGGLALNGLLGGDVASGNSATAPVSAPLDVAALPNLVTGDHGLLDLHGAHIL